MDPFFDVAALKYHRQRAHPFFSPLLFQEVARRLLERLQGIRRDFTSILDITPWQTGTMAPFLQPLYPCASITHASEENYCCSPEGTFDCIISALTLHWIPNLPEFLTKLRFLLRPDGLLIASFWGGNTLYELRSALIHAEANLTGGLRPRMSPMISVWDVTTLFQSAAFALPVVDHDTLTVYYPDLFSLGRHLRAMGETNALHSRPRTFTPPGLFQQAQDFYRKEYGTPANEIPATFQLITVTGWAPADNQQKALRPGSGHYHLKDILE